MDLASPTPSTHSDFELQPRPTGDASRRAPIPETRMRVRKRAGHFEPVDVTKIVRAVQRCSRGLTDVDPLRVATRTISGLYDGATTRELDLLSIQTAAGLMAEEPLYSRLAARLLSTFIDKEVRNQDIHSFSQSVRQSLEHGLVSPKLNQFVADNHRKLDDAIEAERNDLFEYFGLRTVYDLSLIHI